MEDFKREPNAGYRGISLQRGRGGERWPGSRGQTTSRTGWTGRGRGEQGIERSHRNVLSRGSRTSWRHATRGGRNSTNHDSLEGQPVGDLIETVTLTELQSMARRKDETPRISDCQYVASYNWLNGQKAAIVVPGSPPAWVPPKICPNLQEDKGVYLRDQNAARYPRFPIEPAVRSILTLQPKFDTTTIDIVGCGGTLGSLIRVLREEEKTFRFYAELIGRTVFFVRKEKSPTEAIEGVRGYGHTFPEAYTSWEADVKNSVTHQRLVKYVFGGLRCLVRYESDGYIKETSPSEGEKAPVSTYPPESFEDDGLSSLTLAANSIAVGEKVPRDAQSLTIKAAGHPVPQTANFDLKTRAFYREFDMEEVYPRLWLTQTPKFILAYHDKGHFNDIRVEDVSKDVKAWETRNQNLLHQYSAILHQIIDVAKRAPGHKIEVRRVATGPLQIRKPGESDWNALPPDLKERWAGKATNKNGASSELLSAQVEKTDSESESDGEGGASDDYLRF